MEDFMREYILSQGISAVWGFPEEKQIKINYKDCKNVKDIVVQDVLLKFTGRKMNIKVNFRPKCLGKTIALGVVLQEKEDKNFITRGMKVCTVNLPKNGPLTNVLIDDFCFIFPEWDLCVSRTFKICIIAHYLFLTK